MKKSNLLFVFVAMLFGTVAMAQPGDIPNADPGKCYAKCLIPEEYESITEQILVKPASVRTEVVPATYETLTENVMVKAESRKLIPVPAEYETVSEQILIKAETKRLISIPAEYETVSEQYLIAEASSRIETANAIYETQTEQIETAPASTKWVKKKADKNCLSADPNDCLVWCLVETPARFKSVSRKVRVGCPSGYADNGTDCSRSIEIPAEYGSRKRRVVKTPASTREEVIPAEYKSITRRVVKTPASVREEVIPAEYGTSKTKKVKTPASTRTIEVPAEYQTITKRRLVRPGGFTEWREVVCGNKITTSLITQVQRALIERGYDVGPHGVDNVFGTDTKEALVKYQKEKGLPIGQLDKETLKSLNITNY